MGTEMEDGCSLIAKSRAKSWTQRASVFWAILVHPGLSPPPPEYPFSRGKKTREIAQRQGSMNDRTRGYGGG